MAVNSIFLRPSADISVGHTKYPAESTAGYLLIDDETYDSGSTYLQASADASTSLTLSSSFKLSGSVPSEKFNIIGAKIIYRLYANSYCSNASVSFTTNINGQSFVSDPYTFSETSIAYSTEQSDITFNNNNAFVNAINNYIASNGSLPEITISFTTSHTATSKGAGYINMTQVYIELLYDICAYRRVLGKWETAIAAYKKINGYWTKIDNGRSILSSNPLSMGYAQTALAYVSPTCTKTGLTKGYKCAICGDIIVAQEVIPANGHTVVIDEGYDATCGADGLTEGSHCSVCNEILVPQVVIPATGNHDYILQDNDSDHPGLYVCSVCGDIIFNDIIQRYDSNITLNVPRSDYAATANAGNVYALFAGGYSYNSDGKGSRTNMVEAFNTSLTKSTPAGLSNGVDNNTGASVGAYALFSGGTIISKSSSTDAVFNSTVDAYNTSLTRTNPSALSAARHNILSSTIGNYALFAGGMIDNTVSGEYTTVDAYNTSLTKTIPAALSYARSDDSTAVSNGNYALFFAGDPDIYTVDAYNTSLTRTTIDIVYGVKVTNCSIGVTVGNYALFSYTDHYSDKYTVAIDNSLSTIQSTKTSYPPNGTNTTTLGDYGLIPRAYCIDVYDISLVKTAIAPLPNNSGTCDTCVSIGDYALFYTASKTDTGIEVRKLNK